MSGVRSNAAAERAMLRMSVSRAAGVDRCGIRGRFQQRERPQSPWPSEVWNEEENLGGACDLVQAGGLAAESAQVEELGAPDLVRAKLFNLVDDLGVVGEDALDALAEAHLAHREGTLRPF